MRQYDRSRRGLHRRETKWLSPCARSIFRLLHHSKRDMPALRARQTESTRTKPTKSLPSCDNPKPFHFAVEPDAVNDQRNRRGKRRDRACKIDRRAFHEIDPDARGPGPHRKQRPRNKENTMESFKGHLPQARVLV